MLEKDISPEEQIKRFGEHMAEFSKLKKIREEVENLIHAYRCEGAKSEMFQASLEQLAVLIYPGK